MRGVGKGGGGGWGVRGGGRRGEGLVGGRVVTKGCREGEGRSAKGMGREWLGVFYQAVCNSVLPFTFTR